jgi:long-chain acyl-CoA synthetase
MNFYDLFSRWAATKPSAVAITFEGRDISYSELHELVRRTATALRDVGVEPGDRVLLYAPNVPEFLAIYFACAYVGAVFAPANVGFRARELSYVCANGRPKLAIVHADALAAFSEYTAGVDGAPEQIVVLGGDGPVAHGQHRFEDLLGEPAAGGPVDCTPETDLLICYTSGTTSNPKPVLHSHGSEVSNAEGYAGVLGLSPADRGLVCLPLAWVYGLSTTSSALLTSGATVELLPRFHPVEVVRTIERARVTAMFGAMTMYQKMLDVLTRERHDLSSLRIAMNGGEPCTESAVHAFEVHTGCRLQQAYALSEARPIIVTRPGDADVPRQSCGQVVPGAEVRLIGDDGQPVGAGEPGEAEVRCPGMMTGYNREPAMTSDKMTADGFFKSGDLLMVNDDGYFFVVGRRSDMIIRSGVNIAPAEIESVILTHDGVLDAAIVGVPDEASGEAVVAFVVPAEGSTLDVDELTVYLAQELASYKVPRDVYLMDELPVNTSGKRDRRALKVRYDELSRATAE